ncbi:DMT family transporter [Phyllobacterium sp. P30BS-XVII]|uniref:DMT family transporter n=1 Tax=Phyllobacterium sp. P30BS-XVII TaxID=2587046 RepID=UPI0015F9F309|nr:DMT family transporter [Phyllobacterium sp. P30BS-XVII]MBA8903166.1 transporter family-2 protein [Phyllobacterium sp. P30BS-XVII]
MQSLAFLVAALISGSLVPFQAGANAALGRALGHPLWATMVSLMISAICVVPVMMALRVSAPTIANLTVQPKWIWIGGVAGVIYITAALLFAPKLGAAGFMTAVIAGQILASMAIDYFGVVGFTARPISGLRLVGALLVVAGVLIMQGPSLWRMVQSDTQLSTQP